MKRLVSVILTLLLVFSLAPFALAASEEAETAANALYELGLFQGTAENEYGSPVFDLDRAPNRNEAVTMLVRLLGAEEEALAGEWETPFTDVPEWAAPYVGYAFENALTDGVSETEFGGSANVSAAQYLTFVLRALGYVSGEDFEWDAAWELSDEIGLTGGEYNAETESFTRGDVAVVSYAALSCTLKDSEVTLQESLEAEPAGEPEEEEPAGEELVAYEIEGVGTVYLPAGGEIYFDEQAELPVPTTQCGVNFGDATLHVSVMGPDAYEAAGVPLPESAEEFSQRSGPQADVPEGSVFAYDDFGNYFVQFTRDGRDLYYTLRVSETTAYVVTLLVPEGTMADYSAAERISMVELDA